MSQHEWKEYPYDSAVHDRYLYGVFTAEGNPRTSEGFVQIARFSSPIKIEGGQLYNGWVYHYYPMPHWVPIPAEIVDQGMDAMKAYAHSLWRLKL